MSWIYQNSVACENLSTADRTAWVHSEYNMMVAIEEVIVDDEPTICTVAYETIESEPWPTILPHRTHFNREEAEQRCEEMRRELTESVEFIDTV